MSRFRMLLLGLLAALVLSALASAPASAACSGGTRWVYCSDAHKEIGTPPAAILGTSGIGVLEVNIGGAAVKAECKDGILKGELELLGKRKGFGLGLECKLVKPVGCSINSTVSGDATGQLVGAVGKPEEEFTGLGAGEQFTTVTISGGGCAIAGTYEITGKQLCQLPKGEELLVEHEIVCKKSGSKLKIGTEPASMSSTANAKLESGLSWLVTLGT